MVYSRENPLWLRLLALIVICLALLAWAGAAASGELTGWSAFAAFGLPLVCFGFLRQFIGDREL